jgi:phosphatidylglycerophosphatase A
MTPERAALKKTALGTPAGFLAFGFGSGLSPIAPGTMGTVVAVPFAVVLGSLPPLLYGMLLLLTFILGVVVCGQVSKRLGTHDHGGIVWDEMVGYWLAVALVPNQWQWLLVAFVLFRLFDIFKPWPIRQFDKKVRGGLGIMIDDVVAGLYTLVLLLCFEELLS